MLASGPTFAQRAVRGFWPLTRCRRRLRRGVIWNNTTCARPKQKELMRLRSFAFTLLVVWPSLVGVLGCTKPRDKLPDSAVVKRDDGGNAEAGGSIPGTGATDGPAGVGSGNGTCPADQHMCSGGCVDSRSVMTCGALCEPCPSVAGASVTCDGAKCVVACPTGMRQCLSACIEGSVVCNPTCGGNAQACCPGGSCNSGFICSNGTCGITNVTFNVSKSG